MAVKITNIPFGDMIDMFRLIKYLHLMRDIVLSLRV